MAVGKGHHDLHLSLNGLSHHHRSSESQRLRHVDRSRLQKEEGKEGTGPLIDDGSTTNKWSKDVTSDAATEERSPKGKHPF